MFSKCFLSQLGAVGVSLQPGLSCRYVLLCVVCGWVTGTRGGIKAWPLTQIKGQILVTLCSQIRVRGRKQKKKAFILGDVLSLRWFCTQRPLVYEVCNVSFENVLVALEHAQRSVLDLMQGYLFLCNIGAKAWCKNFRSDPLIIQSHPKFL